MNGVHDFGGMHGYGEINPEQNEPVFHDEWEKRVLGLFVPIMAASGMCVDEFRAQIELMGASNYLKTSYYEHWLHAFEKLLLTSGLVTEEELRSGKASMVDPAISPPVTVSDIPVITATGSSARRDDKAEPKFKKNDLVLVRNEHPTHHTRCPRYVRDKIGQIDRDHGVFVFPDTAAHGNGEKPQHCYSVKFSARELWGDNASESDSIYVDLWDDHLILG